jgi:F-type H+-transporting ATPase subunit delta
MAVRSSARRYAEAAFEIADRDGTLAEWLRDLETASAAFGEGDVAHLLANPAIPHADREQIVVQVLGRRVSAKARNLVLLLVRRGRSDLLPRVATEYHRLYRRREGIVEATVISAAPLDEDELKAIRSRIGELSSGKVEMTAEVDPSILGGVIIRLGDQLIDGSVRGRLERLRNQLAAGAI